MQRWLEPTFPLHVALSHIQSVRYMPLSDLSHDEAVLRHHVFANVPITSRLILPRTQSQSSIQAV
jgi:hypothetical protein